MPFLRSWWGGQRWRLLYFDWLWRHGGMTEPFWMVHVYIDINLVLWIWKEIDMYCLRRNLLLIVFFCENELFCDDYGGMQSRRSNVQCSLYTTIPLGVSISISIVTCSWSDRFILTMVWNVQCSINNATWVTKMIQISGLAFWRVRWMHFEAKLSDLVGGFRCSALFGCEVEKERSRGCTLTSLK